MMKIESDDQNPIPLNDIKLQIVRTDEETRIRIGADLSLAVGQVTLQGDNKGLNLEPLTLNGGFNLESTGTVNFGKLRAKGITVNGVNAWLAQAASAKSGPGTVEKLVLKFETKFQKVGVDAQLGLKVANVDFQIGRGSGAMKLLRLDSKVNAGILNTTTIMQGELSGKFEGGAELAVGDSAVKF